MEHVFDFINLVLKDIWIQNFEPLPIMCKEVLLNDVNSYCGKAHKLYVTLNTFCGLYLVTIPKQQDVFDSNFNSRYPS